MDWLQELINTYWHEPRAIKRLIRDRPNPEYVERPARDSIHLEIYALAEGLDLPPLPETADV